MLNYIYIVYVCFIKYTFGSTGLGVSFVADSSFYKQQNLL